LKYLGVQLDSTLSLNPHCAAISSSLRSIARSIRHIKPCLDVSSANGIAVALGNGRLDYCNSILSGVSQNNTDLLQRAQNAVARAVLGRPFRSSATANLKELHWLPVTARIQFKLCCLVYKLSKKHSPMYLDNLLQNYAPTRTLRSGSELQLVVPKSHLHSTERRFAFGAPYAWNSLPVEIKNIKVFASFRKKLKQHLFKT
jgi:hypothetical protein